MLILWIDCGERIVRAGLLSLAGVGGLWVSSVVQGAAIQFEEFGPFTVTSGDASQLASAAEEVRVHTLGQLQVRYAAAAVHCSQVRMHYYLDGVERGVSGPIPPGKSADYFDFGTVTSGEHIVSLRAQGLTGRCNAGGLSSWGGSLVVRTSVPDDAAGKDSLDETAAALGPVIFYAHAVNYAWDRQLRGIYVTARGDVFGFGYRADPAQRSLAPGGSEHIGRLDLEEKFSHHTRWQASVDANQLREWNLELAASGTSAAMPTPKFPDYDAVTQVIGVYRLDEDSGTYVDVKLCSGGHALERGQRPGLASLCTTLESLLLAYRRTGGQEKQ